MRKNELLTLRVEGFGAEGEGVAHENGMAVFIPRALPGELVETRIVKAEKRFAFGRVERIMEASSERRTPPCPYAVTCGGCSLQHMSYESQLEFKRGQVRDCFRHIAGLEVDVPPVLGMEEPYHYRNKISLPVGGGVGQPVIGYYAPRSHRITDIQSCLIAKEPSDTLVRVCREWMIRYGIEPYHEENHSGLIRHIMMRVSRQGDVMAVLVIRKKELPYSEELLKMLREALPQLVSLCVSVNPTPGNVILGRDYRVLWGEERLKDTLCGSEFLLSPLSFFQINAEQTEKLYNTALKFANLSGDETVADLYCGAGTISMLLARHAHFVTGIEIVPDAVRDAKENAVRNGVSNVRFYCGEAEKQLPLLAEQGLKADVVVLDPPRKGAEEAVLRTVAAIAPKRVVYVSCNPATQARDAKLLTSLGYQITDCQSVDMFCQTAGIENVLGFARISE